jgi:DnaJ family protein C protein 7
MEILTDDFKRRLYDEGYDKKAIEERVQRAERAAHHRSGYHGQHGSG